MTTGPKKLKMDLLPPELIVAHYFAEEQAELEALPLAANEAA